MFNIFKKSKGSKTSKTFSDAPNTAVFTTQFIIRQNRPITYVTHELEDGAWQFFSDDEFQDLEEVAMVVSLKEIIEKDKSILEIADLPLGFIATRKRVDDKWKIEKAKGVTLI